MLYTPGVSTQTAHPVRTCGAAAHRSAESLFCTRNKRTDDRPTVVSTRNHTYMNARMAFQVMLASKRSRTVGAHKRSRFGCGRSVATLGKVHDGSIAMLVPS